MQMRIKRPAKDVIIYVLSAGLRDRDDERDSSSNIHGGEIRQLLLTAEFTLNDGDKKQINNKIIDRRSFLSADNITCWEQERNYLTTGGDVI